MNSLAFELGRALVKRAREEAGTVFNSPRYLHEPGSKKDQVNVRLVDGDRVKLRHSMDFIEGGNDQAKSYIPRGQVWIDQNVAPHDRPPIEIHELVERALMRRGVPYEPAHTRANLNEREVRQDSQDKKVPQDVPYF